MGLLQDVQGVVIGTAERATQGDTEAVGWVVVAFLSLSIVVVLALNQVPSGKGAKVLPPLYAEGLPLIGNALAFAKAPLEMVTRGHNSLGDCFTISMANKRFTFLLSPSAHEVSLLSKDTDVGVGDIYRFTVPVFGPGVIYDTDLDERYFQFKMLGSGLRISKLKGYVPHMVNESESFFAKWGNEGEVDLYKELARLILMTASRCLLGPEVREDMFEEAAELIYILDQGMQVLSLFAPNLPTSAHRKRDQARKDMQKLFQKVIDKRRETGTVGDDLLQVFMQAKRADGSSCDDFTIVGLLIAAIFAGQHTSSITATWIGLHLTRDKDLLSRVLEGQQHALQGQDGQLNYDALMQMNLLHRVMKEVLRMHPPLIFLMRQVENERTYKGMSIPKGDYLFMSPGVTGRLPALWAKPNEFDPDRFAEPRVEDKKARLTFMGFGGGRHGCMGEQFAFLQVKTIWSVLLRDFDLEPVGEMNVPNYEALVVGPKGPTTIRYKRKVPRGN